MIFSKNGTVWTPVTFTKTNIFSSKPLDLFYNKNKNTWVAVGMGANKDESVIAYSNDGIIWFPVKFINIPVQFAYIESLTSNNNGNMWVAGGADIAMHTAIAYSNDGNTWYSATSIESGIFSTGCRKVVYSEKTNMWIIVGTTSDSSEKCIAYSTNGTDWKKTTFKDISFFQNGISVAYNENTNIWVAVGVGDINMYKKGIAYSLNGGTEWNSAAAAFISYAFSGNEVACNEVENIWVAVGNDSPDSDIGSIVYSRNGTGWDYATRMDDNIFSGYGSSVVYYGNMWVAVGVTLNSNEKAIAYSKNGSQWYSADTDSDIFSVGRSVVYNKTINTWVAVGYKQSGIKNIATSTDGIKWSGVVSGYLSIVKTYDL